MKRTITSFIFIGIFLFTKAQVSDTSVTNAFYNSESFYKSMGLELVEKNKLLRVYQDKKLPADSQITRSVDIRWVFNSKSEAKKYLEDNLKLQSEEGFEWRQKDVKIPNAENLHVYREDKGSANMYKFLGYPNVHWLLIFNVDRVVVKVFASGGNTGFEKAKRIAYEAAKTVSNVLRLNFKEEKAKPSPALSGDFTEKLNKAGLQFKMPAGFEKMELKKELLQYFDEAIRLPGYDYEIRYFILPNQSGKKDTSSQKIYRRDREGQFLSIALNVKMSDLGSMPQYSAIDSAACKNTLHADYAMQSFFETTSALTKGYKYCYIYSLHHREKGDAFVVMLAGDEKYFDFFPQLFRRSLSFR